MPTPEDRHYQVAFVIDVYESDPQQACREAWRLLSESAGPIGEVYLMRGNRRTQPTSIDLQEFHPV